MSNVGTFDKRMKVLSYVTTTLVFCGAIPAIGWVNKALDLHLSNDVLMLIVGGLLGLFIDLTKKIWRIVLDKPGQTE